MAFGQLAGVVDGLVAFDEKRLEFVKCDGIEFQPAEERGVFVIEFAFANDRVEVDAFLLFWSERWQLFGDGLVELSQSGIEDGGLAFEFREVGEGCCFLSVE